MKDISIDIETLGTRYDAPVVSIAAVPFDRNTGAIAKTTFYREVTIDSALKAGKLDAKTLIWWMAQSDVAKRVFADSPNKAPLSVALDDLRTFIRGFGECCVWGNGATFDITILEYAYVNGAVGLTPGWDFWNIRDMRTIMDLANLNKKDMPFKGTAHNALDDAIHQAKLISMCCQRIAFGLRLVGAGERVGAKVVAPAQEDEEL